MIPDDIATQATSSATGVDSNHSSEGASSFLDLEAANEYEDDAISYMSLENFSVEVLAAAEITPAPPPVVEPMANAKASTRVSVVLPANLKWPPLQGGAASAEGLQELSIQDRSVFIHALLECLRNSVVGSVLSRKNLESFLEEEMDTMWDGETVNLNPLWEAFQGYSFFTKPMLLATFAQLHEHQDQFSLPVTFPRGLERQLQHATSVAKKQKRYTKSGGVRLDEPIAPVGDPLAPVGDSLDPASAFAIPDTIWDDLEKMGDTADPFEAAMSDSAPSTTKKAEESSFPLQWVVAGVVVVALLYVIF